MAGHTPDWRRELAQAVRDPRELLALLGLADHPLAAAIEARPAFALRVPRPYLARIRRGDPRDPLLLQVLPLGVESDEVPGFGRDPVGDLAARQDPGLLHKYRGRALLVATGACAVHCRYCFRRHFPYGEAAAQRGHWPGILEWLDRHRDVEELILSGGDPLMLSDARLGELTTPLRRRPWIKRLRLHTRVPVVLPSRVDAGLLAWIGALPVAPVVVLHVNHPREIDPAVGAAIGRLRASGCTLLNQSVLLAGVNDDPDVLCGLSESLFAAGVLPYYLHLLDPVAGAAHFAVPEGRARALHRAVHARLPGYLVPRLARERSGAPGKTLIF